jgi:hypothetical protein
MKITMPGGGGDSTTAHTRRAVSGNIIKYKIDIMSLLK